MRIGAYQFALQGGAEANMERMTEGVRLAAERDVRVLAFPECALTGYPPEDVASVEEIDFALARSCVDRLRALAMEKQICLVVGTAEHGQNTFYNSAAILSPTGETAWYRKRALWGWDLDSFSPGDNAGGTFMVDGFRVGVRICYEVRFPEYFRELYREKTDLNLVLFCDRAEPDSPERYELLRAHLRTRACENVCPILSVNNCARYQTAPTIAIDADGAAVSELARHEEGLLVYELERTGEPSFGARGRRMVSDALTGTKR